LGQELALASVSIASKQGVDTHGPMAVVASSKLVSATAMQPLLSVRNVSVRFGGIIA
jgi:hypothetical protein